MDAEIALKMIVQLLVTALVAASTAATAKLTDPEARRVMLDFATCAAKQSPNEAESVLLSQVNNEDIIRHHPKIITPSCLKLGGELSMPGDHFRYALAEAMIRREYPAGLPADIARAMPLVHFDVKPENYQPEPGKKLKPKRLAELEGRRKDAVAFRFLSIYGECVDRKDFAGALHLVLSKVGSDAETRAFAALQAPLSQCLVQGQTLALDRTVLRGTIAMNLYRLAKAPRVAPAAVTP